MKLHDIPTAISFRERLALARYARSKRVVEAGSLLGASTLWMEQLATSVVSIDRHEGYGHPTLAIMKNNLMRYGQGRIEMRVGDALAVLPSVEADVAFIDLTGDQDLTLNVLETLPSSIQVTLVHDCERSRCEGVVRAIQRQASWRQLEQVDTLAILGRR
jgi:precorrin-6B methylase 2